MKLLLSSPNVNAQPRHWLIAGLGNPGKQYAETRHNIGFMVIGELAQRLACGWREERRWPGRVAKAESRGVVWHLLMPTTYMNLSGQAVRGYLDYFQIPKSHLLVVVDDIAIDFGEMRLKERGTAGGHNGLKSVEAHLGTAAYRRLRMGIGDRSHGDLADYVLATFTGEERRELPAFIERGVEVILALADSGFERLMTAVNAKKRKRELDSQENKHE
jgi:PTH1 family peptidyl-tRNA hydrolase